VAFLTVEVASVMRVSKITVYRLVHSGHLPAIRVGRSFRVPEQALHQYLYESYTGSIESTDRPWPALPGRILAREAGP
jgi:excisionase family DNA binding protein